MTLQATALTALAQAGDALQRAAEGIQLATAPAAFGGDQVDLSVEAVQLLVAQTAFEAAIEIAKTVDEVTQTTIDLLA